MSQKHLAKNFKLRLGLVLVSILIFFLWKANQIAQEEMSYSLSIKGHTYRVLLSLTDLTQAIEQLHSTSSTAHIEEALHKFERLTSDNSSQQVRAKQFRDLLLSFDLSSWETHRGEWANSLFTLSQALVQEEQRLLTERSNVTAGSIEQVNSLHNILLAFSLFVLLAGYRILVAYRDTKQNTEQALIEARDSLTKEAERLVEIVNVQQEIASYHGEVTKAMQCITEKAQSITRASGAVIELLEGEEMVYTAVSGSASPFKGIRLDAQSSLSGRSVQSNQILTCTDSETDARVDKVACRKINVRSMILVPILKDKQAVGVIKVLSHIPYHFNETDVISLQLLASVISNSLSISWAMDELSHKNAMLERATQFKSQFLANMSHEIRTPLTSIIGFTETVLAEKMTIQEREEALSIVLRNGRHLLGIINDILDLSKIEAGKMDVEILPVSLFDCISDIGNLISQKAQQKGIEFTFNYRYPLPTKIYTDPTRLKQILINICGNAVKFTDQGSVSLTIEYSPTSQNLSFIVQDTGVGISEEQASKLFSAFTQADASTTRQFGGTGLGLAISKQLCEQLGGSIKFQSNLGFGSTFTITIAVGAIDECFLVEEKPTSKTSLPQQSLYDHRYKGKVLVAEDGPDNQRFISFILKQANIDFEMVTDGSACVERATAERFDLILMDMQMPVMDGYVATKTLRAHGSQIPIVALTANIMKNDIERCLSSGCNDHLGKPFERKDLLLKIGEYLEKDTTFKQRQNLFAGSSVEEDMKPVIEQFARKLPTRFEELHSAFLDADWSKLALLAHKLRGAAMFGFGGLGDIAGLIEDSVTKGDLEKIESYLSSIEMVTKEISKEYS